MKEYWIAIIAVVIIVTIFAIIIKITHKETYQGGNTSVGSCSACTSNHTSSSSSGKDLPEGIFNGDYIECKSSGKIFHIENGKRRLITKSEYEDLGSPDKKYSECYIVHKIEEV